MTEAQALSGLIARRIVSYVEVGDKVEAGQRIGMIRFGSRVNCEIPGDYDLNVNVGEMVVAGLTVIARKRENETENRAENNTENGDHNHAEA